MPSSSELVSVSSVLSPIVGGKVGLLLAFFFIFVFPDALYEKPGLWSSKSDPFGFLLILQSQGH